MIRSPISLGLTFAGLVAVLLPPLANAQLLHRYDFETVGSANDTVGTANGLLHGTATVTNGALITDGTLGALNNGAQQNGVSLPATATAGITKAFSIEVWYTANYNGPWCIVFSFSDGTTANNVLATPATGFPPYPSRVAVFGSGTEKDVYQIYCDQSAYAPRHDMIVTYDGTNLIYYLDGALATYSGLSNSITAPGLNLSAMTHIGIAGGSPWTTDNSINGKIFDFRIYGQALSLSQVAAVYNLGTSPSNSAISNALAVPIPPAQVPLSGSLVRMPFYGSPYLHDPGTMRKDGTNYFIFGDGTGISGIESGDLRNWSPTSAVFPNGPPAWTTNAVPGGAPNYFWAPDLAYFNGLWHVYYAYSQWGTINSVIGVATSPSLNSPVWTDRGKVVQSNYPATTNTDTTAYNCIDPSIYVAANGTVWMSYGSYSSGILVVQIDPTTGMRLNPNSIGAPVANNAAGGGWGSTEEGSCIYQHGGYWYLFVNQGDCCNGTYSTYNIRVGRSSSPTGPYYDRNGVDLNHGGGTMFLESTARYIGPGHAAISNDNGTNWFTYHFYDGLNNGYPTVGMNQLYWSADGWPVLTKYWSAFYPLAADANDSSGAYNGILAGAAAFTSTSLHGKVLKLDGTSGYVSLPLSVGNASTFAAWVKWNGGPAWQRIFDFGNDTNAYFFLTPRANTGVMRFAISTNGPVGEQQINAPFALPTNSWHHVAVTLDGTAGILYFDGAPVATNNSLTIRPWQTTPHNNNLGKSQFPADPLFAGEISSFRIFGRALSAAEISNIYSANPLLAHRYSFNVNQPSPVWDSIGMAPGALAGNAVVTNNVLQLTGAAGGYVNLPGGLVSGCSAVTLECWATFGANSNWARVFDFGDINGAAGQNFIFYSPHTSFGGQRLGTPTANLDIPNTLDNRTLHITCICDPANNYLAVFTNGMLEAALTNPLPPLSSVSTAWSFIGRSLWSSDAYLNGAIDELRIYDGRLTPQQILADDLAGPNVLSVPQSVELTNLSLTTSNGTLILSWPSNYVGARLLMQTNHLAEGISTNTNDWTTVPDSQQTNQILLPVNPAMPAEFYRLVYP